MCKISKTFESGLLDHHILVTATMKTGSFRVPPRKKMYRSYKNFTFECFNIALKTNLGSIKGPTYNEFDEAFCSVLNIYAPLKVKMLRHNNSAFVIKGLRKAILKQSRLRNLFNKQKTHENWINYKMQRNHYVY